MEHIVVHKCFDDEPSPEPERVARSGTAGGLPATAKEAWPGARGLVRPPGMLPFDETGPYPGKPTTGNAPATSSAEPHVNVPTESIPDEHPAGCALVRARKDHKVLLRLDASVEDNNLEALLIRRVKFSYELPRGHLEGKETPQQAAARELKEEAVITSEIYVGQFIWSGVKMTLPLPIPFLELRETRNTMFAPHRGIGASRCARVLLACRVATPLLVLRIYFLCENVLLTRGALWHRPPIRANTKFV